ncbi:MAG: acyl carrier protein [Gammaproteobacteria bacterium]|jgi:acyl carrier protein
MTEVELEQQILDALREIAPELDAKSLDPSKSFRDQVELDSVDFLSFVLNLERRLGLHVPEVDYPKLSSLQGCITYFAPG